MTSRERRRKRRKRLRRIHRIRRCFQRILLCTACMILIFHFVKPMIAIRDGVYAQKSEDADIVKAQEDHEKFVDKPVEEENSEWKLILVNSSHPVDEDYIAGLTFTQLRNGQSVDERCYPSLQQMMDDCRAKGYQPIVCSSFRTLQRQQEIFDQQVKVYRDQGLDQKTAEAKTARSVAIPGTSEHELGLAVDITDMDDQRIVSGMEAQPVQQWLMENSWRYGFILRYPADKSDVTGIVYEPWHYRYVGCEAAKYIYEHQITLEEYLEEEPIR